MDRDVSVPSLDPSLPQLSEGRIPSRRRRFSLLRGELLFRYTSSLYKSDGFDMVSLASLKGQSGTMPHGIISPLSPKCKYSRAICKTVSMRAIDEYQRRRQLRTFFKPQMPPQLEFVKVVKAMSQSCDIQRYFVTFEAKDHADGGKTKTFRTIARWRPPLDDHNFDLLYVREYKEKADKGDQVIHISTASELETQLNAASRTSRLAILYFSDHRCRLYSLLYTSLTAKYPKVVFLQVDIVEGGPQAGGLAADWGVRRCPHFIFFKRGKEVDKFGAISSDGLRSMIAQHLHRRRKRVV
ncbi:uncharacterized protein LOC132171242 [Corylus avellana]|uniref:uncharacterized protein LOC132171242 n=1 Tax=Corylus avellana TaxID=13451 RepID=UPI00286CAF14|nr:uncharacterized protein LOC132171242 [Corylus avellana]